MSYVVVRKMKSKGIAALLVFIFGPLGMFYSTIAGALFMIFIAIPLWVLLALKTDGLALLLSPIYYLICFIWAIYAVIAYNKKLLTEASTLTRTGNTEGMSVISSRSGLKTNKSDQDIRELTQDLARLDTLKESNVVSEAVYLEQRNKIFDSIKLLENNNLQSINAGFQGESIVKENGSNKNIFIIFFFLLILLSIFYWLYDSKSNSMQFDKITSLFSPNTKEQEKIITSDSPDPKHTSDITTESKILFKVDETTFDDILSKRTNYKPLTSAKEINSLLTERLKIELNINNSPTFLTDDYKFYKIGEVKYKNFILQFFIYNYTDGIADAPIAQMNVCDQEGLIVDTKKIGEDYADPEVKNDYSIIKSIVKTNGEIVMTSDEQQGKRKQNKTIIYCINDSGKISRK